MRVAAHYQSNRFAEDQRRGRMATRRELLKKGTLATAGLVFSQLALPPNPAQAYEDSRQSPSGVYPWHYTEKYRMTCYYGQYMHQAYTQFGFTNEYYALDFGLPEWKRLYAMYDGSRVSLVNGDVLEMTKVINGETYRIRYRHMNQINVSVGAIVNTNTLVGYSGNKGFSTGRHLHVAVHRLRNGAWYSCPPTFCGGTIPAKNTRLRFTFRRRPRYPRYGV